MRCVRQRKTITSNRTVALRFHERTRIERVKEAKCKLISEDDGYRKYASGLIVFSCIRSVCAYSLLRVDMENQFQENVSHYSNSSELTIHCFNR